MSSNELESFQLFVLRARFRRWLSSNFANVSANFLSCDGKSDERKNRQYKYWSSYDKQTSKPFEHGTLPLFEKEEGCD